MSRKDASIDGLTPAKKALLELRLRQRAERAATSDGPAPRPAGAAVPLSFAQHRLWLLQEIHPDLSAYNVPRVLRLRGALDVAALEGALSEIVRRHEVLRSAVVLDGEEPVCHVLPPAPVVLERVDLAGEADPEAAAEPLVAEEMDRPFDLGAGRLVRGRLLRFGPEDHLLVLVTHHIASDEGSKSVLFGELADLYAALTEGRPSPLAPLALQYGDVALWERARADSEAIRAGLAWWREHLEGAPAELDLPTDLPRPADPTFAGARHIELLPEALLDGLRTVARAEGATLFMALLAAFDVLLQRISGQDDVVVGVPITSRTRPELQPLVGLFANTFALRARMDDDPSFRELVGRVRATAVEAYQRQDVPFERVVEELAPDRESGRHPVFQVMFNFLETPAGEAPALAGLDVEALDVDPETSKFDLALIASVRDGGLKLMWEYSTDLFVPETIAELTRRFATLLEAAAAAPESPVSTLALLTAEEEAAVAGQLARTAAPIPAGGPEAQLAARAATEPGRPAATCDGRTLGYAELDAQANRIAHALREAGVGRGDLVGLYSGRSVDLLAGVLGVLKAGGAYVPLDPAFPADRLAYMLEDSGARVLLTTQALRDDAPGSCPVVVCLDDPALAQRPSTAPPATATPDDLAYVIYTSGSTGLPKGVMVERGNLSNLLASMIREPGIAHDDVLLAVTTLSFDIAGLELLGPLCTGAHVVLAGDGVAADPEALQALMVQSGATVMQATPSTWRMLVDAGWAGDGRLKVLCGGEALPRVLADQLLERAGSVWNVYGPTETTIWSTCGRVGAGEGPVPIGRPIANTACYVLDRHDRPVPRGSIGELCIGGAGVTRGYHARPELTAERFAADPFAPGGRMYRTGDLVRERRDGELEFLGRRDHQVKLRGFRIELGEIEAVLARHPDVRQAVAVVHEDAAGGQQLVAHVVGAVDADDLLRHAAQALPGYMVPGLVMAHDALPLTANNKVDRKALPAPALSAAADRVAPRTELERRLAALWEAVLGIDGVGVHDSFFRLGGHSLSGTRLVVRVNQELGLRLPMRTIFEAPTIAQLVAVIEAEAAREEPAVPAPVLARGSRARRRVPRTALQDPAALQAVADGGAPASGAPEAAEALVVFPASFQQQRAWFLDRLEPAKAAYNVPLCLDIAGPLDAEALRRALDALAARHEALRTTFAEHDGTPLQVVHPPAPFALRVVRAASEGEALELARAESAAPFDLEHGPLARAQLIEAGPERHLLALTLHHAVADGWSLNRLAAELGALLRGEDLGPDDGVQYGDYAVWQRSWMQGSVLDAELAWWRGRLVGAPAHLELPTDHPRPVAPTHAGARHVEHLDAALLAGIERVAGEADATPYMVLLAACTALLSRYCGQDDIVVGSPISGRQRPELESLVGYVANTLVLRTDTSGDPTFLELVARARETAVEAYAHQDVPFDKLVDELAVDRDLSRHPLFQVLLILQDDEAPVPDVPGASVALADIDRGVSRFDLSLSFARRDGALRVACEYSSELFEPGSIARLLHHLRTLVAGAVAAPEAPLSQLPLLAPEEEAEVAAQLQRTARPIPERLVHQRLGDHAAQRPDAIAVTSAGRSLTYAELDRRSSRLAHALQAAGVQRGDLVALFCDRSVDLLVGMHGVLKTGAAYIPLDPSYPADRSRFVIEDARARVLVTRSDLEALLPAGGEARVLLDADLSAFPETAPAVEVSHDDRCYVIYTSGSTGRPKGVMVEHRGLVNLLQHMAEQPGLRAGETMLGVTTPAFDLSVPDLYLPVFTGARLALATAEEAVDPRELARVLRETEATVMQATPATWRMLLDDGWLPERPMRVVVGGEAVPPALAARLRDVMDGVWNFYGPTETTVWSTCWRVGELGAAVPIGRPIANTACYVLDAHDRPVAPGVVGELCLGGAGVTRGYLERPELTAEKFVADPFVPGGRMYRTGDLARLRPDGELEFVGRRDHQIKLRGFRIELGEIEAMLAEHPAVRQAVVIVREDVPGEPRLVGYVVPAAPVTAEALSAHLGEHLPRHMIPGAIVELERLPLTPNGKLDRTALPAPQVVADRPTAAPRTPVEEALVELWRDVLGLERVGIHDDFFTLGGHSLLVTRVVARVRSQFGVEVPLRSVYEAPTIADLAQTIAGGLIADESGDDLEELLAELEQLPDDDLRETV